jgi:hypothetical protein
MLLMNKNINPKADSLNAQIIMIADLRNQANKQRIDAGQVGGFISNFKPS